MTEPHYAFESVQKTTRGAANFALAVAAVDTEPSRIGFSYMNSQFGHHGTNLYAVTSKLDIRHLEKRSDVIGVVGTHFIYGNTIEVHDYIGVKNNDSILRTALILHLLRRHGISPRSVTLVNKNTDERKKMNGVNLKRARLLSRKPVEEIVGKCFERR